MENTEESEKPSVFSALSATSGSFKPSNPS